MRLEDEIQQKAFKNEYQKLQVNILFTASWLSQRTNQLLKPYKLSLQQFNILRILRGCHPKPATIKLLSERMVDKMSNASRLVEKLRQKGYIERVPCETDRRRVDITITQLGLETLEIASTNLEQKMEEILRKVDEKSIIRTNQVLDQLRD